MLKKMLFAAGCVAFFSEANGMMFTQEQWLEATNEASKKTVEELKLQQHIDRSVATSVVTDTRSEIILATGRESLLKGDIYNAYCCQWILENPSAIGRPENDTSFFIASNTLDELITGYKLSIIEHVAREIYKVPLENTNLEDEKRLLNGLADIGEHFLALLQKNIMPTMLVIKLLDDPSGLLHFHSRFAKGLLGTYEEYMKRVAEVESVSVQLVKALKEKIEKCQSGEGSV